MSEHITIKEMKLVYDYTDDQGGRWQYLRDVHTADDAQRCAGRLLDAARFATIYERLEGQEVAYRKACRDLEILSGMSAWVQSSQLLVLARSQVLATQRKCGWSCLPEDLLAEATDRYLSVQPQVPPGGLAAGDRG